MDGNTLKAGSVAGVTTIKNPISAARKVMENTPHVMLIGKGADDFAQKQGLEIVENSYFITEERTKLLQQVKEEEKKGSQGMNMVTDTLKKFGTVGAVALDKFGNIAAATSTGGMTNKKFGRVVTPQLLAQEPMPIIKLVEYLRQGHGEYFIRSVVAYDISALME